jgi:hypothetical protein
MLAMSAMRNLISTSWEEDINASIAGDAHVHRESGS